MADKVSTKKLSDLVAPPVPEDKPEPRKGLLGLPRSEEGLGKIVNFLGNDIFFWGAPPQTMADLAGNIGMAVGMSAIPIAGPALSKAGYARLAKFITKVPGSIQRILAGAMGDEIARDLITGGSDIGEGFKTGATGAAIGEAGVGALRGGVKIAKGAAGLAKDVGVAAVKRLPGGGPILRQMSIEKRAAGKSEIQVQQQIRRAYQEARKVYEQAEAAREAEHGAKVTAFERGTATAAKETAKRQAAAGDVTIQQQLKKASQGTAQEMGRAVGEVSPPLKFQTGSEASDLGTFRGRYRASLGKYWNQTLTEAEGMLPPNATIRVPALSTMSEEATLAVKTLEQITKRPLNEGEMAAIKQQYNIKDRFTLRELAEELKNHQSGYRGTGAFSDTRTRQGLAARKVYSEALQQAEEEIRSFPGGEAAWNRFSEGRLAFSVGDIVLKLLSHEKAFTRGPEGAELNLKGLQELVRKNAQKLEDRMPADDFKALKRIIYGGEDVSVATSPRVGKTGVEGGGIMPYRKAEPVQAPERPVRGPGPWIPKPERPAFMTGPSVPGATADVLRGREFPYPFSWKEWGQIAVDAAAERMVAPGAGSGPMTIQYQPGVGQVPPLPQEGPTPPAGGPPATPGPRPPSAAPAQPVVPPLPQ